MKRILIICYDYPPLPSVGGQRPFSWFKHFNKFGIRPTVITRNWRENISELSDYFEKDEERVVEELAEGTIIRSPYLGSSKSKSLKSTNPARIFARKLLTVSEHAFKWYLPKLDDKHFLYQEAREYLKANKVDIILVTGEPFILFKYGHQLSKEFNTPWISDYRDGWSTNHSGAKGILKILRKHQNKLERKYLSNALFASSASEYIINANKKLFPNVEQYLHPNGIDLEIIEAAAKMDRSQDRFTITFSGSVYEAHNVEDFFSALEIVFEKYDAENFLVQFIGIDLRPSSSSEKIKDYAQKYPEVIKIIKPVPHQESIAYQLSSHVLIKFDYTGQFNALLGAKLYEYAATKKPIITVLSIDDQRTTFFPGRDIQHMASNANEVSAAIDMLYEKYKNGETVESSLTDDEIQSFSRSTNIKNFAKHIEHKLSE